MGTFTWATGLGMLAVGIGVLAIASVVFLIVIKKIETDKKEAEETAEREKIYGSR
jgi:hypothetical protein